jgi:glycosyltransferase involved in cell wall biosynthesis
MWMITVIIPVYNEAENLGPLYDRLANVTAGIPNYEFEFLFVDDGSIDNSAQELATLHGLDKRVKAIHFSRNFGSHAACLAGLTYARGDLAAILAADLQDPPELIPQLLAKIEEGFDIVFAAREGRQDNWLTVKLANIYHRLMRRYAIANWPEQGADVVMLRRTVRDILVHWRQKNTSLFAQMLWTGFRQTQICYVKARRRAGHSKWNLRKKIKLFVDSFVSFSFAPIRFIAYAGFALSALGFGYAAFIMFNKMLFNQAIAGWSCLMVALLIVSGFQLLSLGLIGEYLWRIADEVRGAPVFLVDAMMGVEIENAAKDPLNERPDVGKHTAIRVSRGRS